MWTYACGAARARVICAAIPLRIWVIGSRTSSAPSGNVIGAPAGRAGGVGAVGAAGGADGAWAASAGWRDCGAAGGAEPFVAWAGALAGAGEPLRIASTT